MKLKFSFDVDGNRETFESKFQYNVLNRTLNKDSLDQKENERFGFTAQTFPADSLKYWYENPDDYYQTKITEGPDDSHRAAYLRDETARGYLKQFLKPLKESNASFAFATGYHKQIIQWAANFKNEMSLQEIQELISNNSFEDIMSQYSNDIEFTFTFNSMMEYLKIITEIGIPALDISLFENGGFSSWIIPKGSLKGPEVDWSAKIINSKNGKPDTDFDVYSSGIILPMLKSMVDQLWIGYNKNEFILENGEKVKILINTDEINEKSLNKISDLIAQVNDYSKSKYDNNFEPIGMNSFMGWRSDIDLSNENYLENNFINSYDQYIFHAREVYSAVDNTTWKRLENSISKRKSNDKSTMFYSTYGDYPGSYMSSDISESFWNIIFGRKLNLNGFLRWAYDKVYDDYFETEDFNAIETGDELREPGQSFLIYGGDEFNGVHYSVRMLAMMEAVQLVYKFDSLKKEGRNDKILNEAMNNVGISNYAHNNNFYKWNLNKDWKFAYMTPNEGYKKPVGMQVYEFIKTLEKL